MKKLFKINITTIITLFLCIITGQIKTYLFFMTLSFVHEMGHFLMCLVNRVKVKQINILPFGCNMQVINLENVSSKKQIIIYFAGPATYFLNALLINKLIQFNLISVHTIQFLKTSNLIISLFNLLPIYPLDGYRIINGILTLLLPYKKALNLSIIISLIFLILFIIYNFYNLQILVLLFLIFEQLKHFKEYKMIYKRFLFYKTKRRKHKRFKIIKDKLMYKDMNNYLIVKEKIYDDVDIALSELKNFHKKIL